MKKILLILALFVCAEFSVTTLRGAGELSADIPAGVSEQTFINVNREKENVIEDLESIVQFYSWAKGQDPDERFKRLFFNTARSVFGNVFGGDTPVGMAYVKDNYIKLFQMIAKTAAAESAKKPVRPFSKEEVPLTQQQVMKNMLNMQTSGGQSWGQALLPKDVVARLLEPLPQDQPALGQAGKSQEDEKERAEVAATPPAGIDSNTWNAFRSFASQAKADLRNYEKQGQGGGNKISSYLMGALWRKISEIEEAFKAQQWQISMKMPVLGGMDVKSPEAQAQLVDAYFGVLLDADEVLKSKFHTSWIESIAQSPDKDVRARIEGLMKQHQALSASKKQQSPQQSPRVIPSQPGSPVAGGKAPLHAAAAGEKSPRRIILASEAIIGTGSPDRPGWLWVPQLRDSVFITYGRAGGPEITEKDGKPRYNFSYKSPAFIEGQFPELPEGLYFWKSMFNALVQRDKDVNVPGVYEDMNPVEYANVKPVKGQPTRSRLRFSNSPDGESYLWTNDQGGFYSGEKSKTEWMPKGSAIVDDYLDEHYLRKGRQ